MHKFGFCTVKIYWENSGIEVFCWNNVAYRSHMASQKKCRRKDRHHIGGSVNQVNNSWHATLL